MDSSSHPLRPYYVAPAPDASWQLPSAAQAASAGQTTAASSRIPATATNSLKLATPNRYEPSSLLADGESPTAGLMLRAFVTSSILSFTSTALVMPFEVGKTLAQVQWVPRDGVEPTFRLDENGQAVGGDEEAVEFEDEHDDYFGDSNATPSTSAQLPFALPLDQPEAVPETPSAPQPWADEEPLQAEKVKQLAPSFADKPEWIMPVVVQGGVWDMIKTVGRWKGEGWASLWKAQLTTCVLDSLTSFIQPLFLSGLTIVFLPSSSLSGLPLIYSPRPVPLLLFSTLSHTITSVLLSPLDLVRTRLIVQSAQPAHRKYSGPVDALQAIVREEGGWSATYFHSNLLIPTVLEGVVRPLIHLASPLIISRYLHLEPSTSPVWFGLAELVLGASGLLLTIPIETVRKRLQIQSRAPKRPSRSQPSSPSLGRQPQLQNEVGPTAKAWRTCVETRPNPYAGVVEAVYRILTEETGQIPRRRRTSRGSKEAAQAAEKEDLHGVGLGAANGLRQLYRGFGMGLTANVVVFVLGLIAGNERTDKWAEI